MERLPVLLVDSVLAEDDDAVNEEPRARSEETLQPGVVVHGVEEHEALVVVHRTAKALENNEDNREERRNFAIEELSQRSCVNFPKRSKRESLLVKSTVVERHHGCRVHILGGGVNPEEVVADVREWPQQQSGKNNRPVQLRPALLKHDVLEHLDDCVHNREERGGKHVVPEVVLFSDYAVPYG